MAAENDYFANITMLIVSVYWIFQNKVISLQPFL